MKLGIALSGGGIRGIAHAGVLQALEENNIKPDIIGGTSCGSMVAVMYAMGYSPYHIYLLFKRYAKEIAKVNTIPALVGINDCIFKKRTLISGCNNGKKMEELYDRVANRREINNIKDIKMPIVIPTVDMRSGIEIVFTNNVPNCVQNNVSNIVPNNIPNNIKNDGKKGNCNKIYINNITIGKAIRASSSFPGFYSPCAYKEYIFMDGGVLNNVPVDEVKLQGADYVIAVKFRADEINDESNIMDVVMKSIDIMGNKISARNLQMSDYILEVYSDKVGLLDVEKLDKCYEYGYNAVMENLEKIKRELKLQ